MALPFEFLGTSPRGGTFLQCRRASRSISFTTCLNYLALSWNRVYWIPLSVWRSQIGVNLLELSKHRVGQRPGRFEPRQLKRRLKAYNQLQLPREQTRKKLLQKIQKNYINSYNTCGCAFPFWTAEAETQKEKKRRITSDFLAYKNFEGKFADFL